MPKFTVIFCAFLFCVTWITSSAQISDEEGVKQAVMNYLDGGTYGDTVKLNKAFHTSASMKYIDNKTGEYRDVPISEFLNRAKANVGKTSNRKTKIVYTTISGTAAQARLEIDGGTYVFHDYMNLLKIKGEWKIVSKIFWREDKPAASK
ncbi:MAG: nuclear transport factor 2 family protein [Chitinophagaceae bacterium]|nr:nuclear transport factor 2 family protein [Chitinophagaceae bacterium]